MGTSRRLPGRAHSLVCDVGGAPAVINSDENAGLHANAQSRHCCDGIVAAPQIDGNGTRFCIDTTI